MSSPPLTDEQRARAAAEAATRVAATLRGRHRTGVRSRPHSRHGVTD